MSWLPATKILAQNLGFFLLYHFLSVPAVSTLTLWFKLEVKLCCDGFTAFVHFAGPEPSGVLGATESRGSLYLAARTRSSSDCPPALLGACCRCFAALRPCGCGAGCSESLTYKSVPVARPWPDLAPLAHSCGVSFLWLVYPSHRLDGLNPISSLFLWAASSGSWWWQVRAPSESSELSSCLLEALVVLHISASVHSIQGSQSPLCCSIF